MLQAKIVESKDGLIKELCGACGLCCNGAIFGDVELRPRDDQERLVSLGLIMGKTQGKRRRAKFFQPCPAHHGCQCRIYSERPEYCREFECALLKNVCSAAVAKVAALGLIREAREKLSEIEEVLSRLGKNDQTVSHRVRFQQLTRELMRNGMSNDERSIFSELTIAVHEFNLLIAKTFYPGEERLEKT